MSCVERESLMGREREDGDSVTNKWALFCFFIFSFNWMTMGQYRFYREKYRVSYVPTHP